jgi:hyaluronan synthase
MEISYWYAFNAGRGSQSAVNSVSTVSGAMGLFNSKAMRLILDDYATQRFLCGRVKCIFGEDRHLTSGLIINGHSVLYDREALALTECPKSVHNLVIQQTRWYKGFYR